MNNLTTAGIKITADGGFVINGIEIVPDDWLTILVPAISAADETGEAAAAIRMLTEKGFILPVPKPIIAQWDDKGSARLQRNLDRLGLNDDEAETTLSDLGLTDDPATDPIDVVTETAARLARIDATTTRIEAALTTILDAVDAEDDPDRD